MTIKKNIEIIYQQILSATQACHRLPQSVVVMAVSKGQSIDLIKQAYQSGLRHFGESYWQDAAPKLGLLQSYPLTWHFIGPIQSNKAVAIAEHFHWVHSVSREKIAQRLSQSRPLNLGPLNICLQVNLDNEPSKSGLALMEVQDFIQFILTLPNLKLRGLMTIPAPCQDPNQQYQRLKQLSHLLTTINLTWPIALDTLSMGMSHDFISAIHAGSTIVRLGQAIFGLPKKNIAN